MITTLPLLEQGFPADKQRHPSRTYVIVRWISGYKLFFPCVGNECVPSQGYASPVDALAAARRAQKRMLSETQTKVLSGAS